MKAILVIETDAEHIEDPSCEECPCFHEDRDVCQAGGMYGKPCPLRPLPEKKFPSGSEIYNDYVRGWNACIDEILGETE